MFLKSYTHIVTNDDIHAIKQLGYHIVSVSGDEPEFVNNCFSNLDLLRLLNDIDLILTPYCNSSIERIIYFYNTQAPKIEILFHTNNYSDENEGLALFRTFTWQNDELIVSHNFFRLPQVARYKGISKLLLRSFLQQYINMGVKKIKVFAALADGGYVWARSYFTADLKSEMDVILSAAKEKLNVKQFNAVLKIFNNYYNRNPAGEAFPIQKWAAFPFMVEILRGSKWNGTIDLTIHEQFSNFISYAFG